jgi:hypothetical protein
MLGKYRAGRDDEAALFLMQEGAFAELFLSHWR